MTSGVATNIIVPGRGHEIAPDGSLSLSASALQRVHTAVDYFNTHRLAFEQADNDGSGGVIIMSGGYAGLATGNKMSPPPHSQRESTLMYRLAKEEGVPERYLRNSASSTSTLENMLRVSEEGYFDKLSPENPLGIVTQHSQWNRLNWFAQKVFKLPPEAVLLVPSPGEEDANVMREEQKLMRITKVIYGLAETPYGLRRAERIASLMSRTAGSLGLQKPPASTYLETDY